MVPLAAALLITTNCMLGAQLSFSGEYLWGGEGKLGAARGMDLRSTGKAV